MGSKKGTLAVNEIEDALLLKLRTRVVRVTGDEDLAQEACIDLLHADLNTKPIEFIIRDLVKKYRSKSFRKKRTRREVPVSELLGDGDAGGSEDFLDSLVDQAAREGVNLLERAPESLRPALEWLELGYSVDEAARLCGISYDALRWRFHYHIKKLLRTSHTG